MKRLIRLPRIIVLTIGLAGLVDAQNKFILSSYAPPAPNAAELGKYGTFPVGVQTGTPKIDFTLYEIKAGRLKLPITLSYHASGILVNQRSTDVGLGWVVSAGGTITRTVYGGKDEGVNGYFNYTPPSNTTALYGIHSFDTLDMFSYEYRGKDLEPDLFTYSIGDKSGKFIFNKATGNFLTIPFEPISVHMANDASGVPTFRMLDDDGTAYEFLLHTNSSIDGNSPSSSIMVSTYASSWYLSRIVSSDYIDTISFQYQTSTTSEQLEQHVYTLGGTLPTSCETSGGYITGGSNGAPFDKNYTNVVNSELLTTRISFRNGHVDFFRGTPRQDVTDQTNANMLDSVVVYDFLGQRTKSIVFSHDYFASANTSGKKLRLACYQETGYGGLSKKYGFGYEPTPIPTIGSYSQDYWGYYNGQENNSLIPHVQVNGYSLTPVSFADGQTYNFPSSMTSPLNTYDIGSANREPVASYMAAGILNRITYPTGGYSCFTFEPHQYMSVSKVQQALIQGGRTTGINARSKSQNVYSFVYAPTVNTFAVLLLTFSKSIMTNPYVDDVPQKVTLTDMTTNSTQSWVHTGDFLYPLNVTTTSQLTAGHSYTLTVVNYGGNTTYVDCYLKWNQDTQQDVVKSGGGLRIKSIRNYDAGNSLLGEENYVYGTNEDGIGTKLFDEATFYRNFSDQVLESYYQSGSDGSNPGGGIFCACNPTVLQRSYLGIPKYAALSYLGSPVLYPKVTKYHGSTSGNTGKTVYNYSVVQDPLGIPYDFINSGNYGSVNNAWHQGDLTNEVLYKNNGGSYQKVGETVHGYSLYNVQSMPIVHIRKYKQLVHKMCAFAQDQYGNYYNTYGGTSGLAHFSAYQYPVTTGAVRETSTTKILYGQTSGSNMVSESATYRFDNPKHLYPTAVVTGKSTGKTTVSRIKYPQDESDAVSLSMSSRNMLSFPLEEKKSLSDGSSEVLESTLQTKYRTVGSQIVKDQVSYSTYSNPLRQVLFFGQYDQYGNVQEQQKMGDVKEVYLWGYNGQYPVAKVVGSDIGAVLQKLPQPNVDAATAVANNDAAVRTLLNGLRTAFQGNPQVQVWTYTYAPLVGMTSETDPKGVTTYYEYDGFGRLQYARDKDGNVLKKYSYNYTNQ